MADELGQKYLLYHYDPSKVAAIIFCVLFAITTALHTFQLLKKRTWYFIPFLIGGIFETLGYVGRILNAGQSYGSWTTGPYIMQSLTLLLAPALFAASIYMVLGRLIRLLDGEAHSPIRTKWLTPIFVTGDVISFLAQSGGGGMLAKAKKQSDVSLGEHIITGGLGIQVLFFAIFMIVTAIFNYRIRAAPSLRSQQLTVPWQSYLYVLYGASFLILVRSVFRIAEYVMGSDGTLLGHEYFLYIFDAALMFIAMVSFNVYHPSRIINSEAVGDAPKHRRHRHRIGDRDPESQESSYDLQEHGARVERKGLEVKGGEESH